MKSQNRAISCLLIFFLFFLQDGALAQHVANDAIILHEDGSVTFQYKNPDAKSVKLYCDCELHKETTTALKEDYSSVKMNRDSNGVWSYTTPPLPPEVYTYMFEQNGRNFPDPTNPDSIRVRRDRMSVFIIPGAPNIDLCIDDPLHGKMDTLEFKSPDEELPRRIIIYTPPCYAENERDYPVLYLLHGLNGNETAWNDRGRAVQILDNLIEQKKAVPMILVMPDANPTCLVSQAENVGLLKNMLLYPAWADREFEKCYPAMDKFIDETYRLSNEAGSRAAAGLSAGAKQSCNLVNMYDSTFSSVGLFSPVVGRKQIPHSAYTTFWIAGGTSDIFYCRINKFRKKLARNQIPHVMYESVGGHTWRNWRTYFSEYVQTLFRN